MKMDDNRCIQFIKQAIRHARLNNFRYALKDPVRALKFLLNQTYEYSSVKQLVPDASDKIFVQHINEMRLNKRLAQLEYTYINEGIQESGLLYLLVRILRPITVLETGVCHGKSSTFILQALKDNKMGALYSIDIEKRRWIVPYELRHYWHFIFGSSNEKLAPLLEELGQIGMFLHDSAHTYENMLFEYQTVWPFIRKNGILLSHNISYNNAFFDFCKIIRYKGILLAPDVGGIKKV